MSPGGLHLDNSHATVRYPGRGGRVFFSTETEIKRAVWSTENSEEILKPKPPTLHTNREDPWHPHQEAYSGQQETGALSEASHISTTQSTYSAKLEVLPEK